MSCTWNWKENTGKKNKEAWKYWTEISLSANTEEIYKKISIKVFWLTNFLKITDRRLNYFIYKANNFDIKVNTTLDNSVSNHNFKEMKQYISTTSGRSD
jgi:hypothetical protein